MPKLFYLEESAKLTGPTHISRSALSRLRLASDVESGVILSSNRKYQNNSYNDKTRIMTRSKSSTAIQGNPELNLINYISGDKMHIEFSLLDKIQDFLKEDKIDRIVDVQNGRRKNKFSSRNNSVSNLGFIYDTEPGQTRKRTTTPEIIRSRTSGSFKSRTQLSKRERSSVSFKDECDFIDETLFGPCLSHSAKSVSTRRGSILKNGPVYKSEKKQRRKVELDKKKKTKPKRPLSPKVAGLPASAKIYSKDNIDKGLKNYFRRRHLLVRNTNRCVPSPIRDAISPLNASEEKKKEKITLDISDLIQKGDDLKKLRETNSSKAAQKNKKTISPVNNEKVSYKFLKRKPNFNQSAWMTVSGSGRSQAEVRPKNWLNPRLTGDPMIRPLLLEDSLESATFDQKIFKNSINSVYEKESLSNVNVTGRRSRLGLKFEKSLTFGDLREQLLR